MFDKMNFGLLFFILILECGFLYSLAHTPLDWWIDKNTFIDKI